MKVSVIVPVRNGARYLDSCLDSIKDAGDCVGEIIIVDDGSVDMTAEKAKKLSLQDSRIHPVSIYGRGSYEARRIGVLLAKYEYIAFIDVDDRFCTGSLDLLADLMDQTNADIVMGGIIRQKQKSLMLKRSAEKNRHRERQAFDSGICKSGCRIIPRAEMWRRIMKWGTQEFVCYVWNKLYRKELFKDLEEGEGICQGDDVLLTCQVFLKAQKIVETSEPVYQYYQTSGSLTRSEFGDRDMDLLKVWDIVVSCMPKGKLRYMARINRWRTDFTLICRLLMDGNPEKLNKYGRQLADWRDSLAVNWKELLRAGNMPADRLAVLICLRFAFSPTRLVMQAAGSLRKRGICIKPEEGGQKPG